MSAILVVDDEPMIREMLMLVLERSGFSVVSAANGVQALYKYHLYRDDIELVICDIAMPEMDGPALAKRLLAERPDLPMIMMSDQCDSIDLASQPALRFLPKPLDLSMLIATVRNLVTEGKSLSTS
jgi:two-component system cell cycle sensor histidine kinase/response regulator CckA